MPISPEYKSFIGALATVLYFDYSCIGSPIPTPDYEIPNIPFKKQIEKDYFRDYISPYPFLSKDHVSDFSKLNRFAPEKVLDVEKDIVVSMNPINRYSVQGRIKHIRKGRPIIINT